MCDLVSSRIDGREGGGEGGDGHVESSSVIKLLKIRIKTSLIVFQVPRTVTDGKFFFY